MDIRMRPWGSWTTRVLVTAFVVSTFVLLLAGAIPAAQAQQPPRLPGSAADAYKPALQENQAEGAIGILAAEEPTTPSLDQFNRSDEYPIWQGGAWSPADPIGGGQLLGVRSLQAGPPDPNTGNNISYRFQGYPATSSCTPRSRSSRRTAAPSASSSTFSRKEAMLRHRGRGLVRAPARPAAGTLGYDPGGGLVTGI